MGDKTKELFKTLKKQFIMEFILVEHNLDRKMRMEVNMSDYAIDVMT